MIRRLLEQRLRAAVRSLRGVERTSLDLRKRVPLEALTVGDVVTVVGQVRCFEEPKLLAPLCGELCAYYHTKLYEKDQGNVLHESGMQSFRLVDPTGEVLVRMDEPEVTLAMDAHVSVGVLAPFDDASQRFLEKHGRQAQSWWYERDIRFEEGLIAEGETVAVRGRVRRARGAAGRYGGYREGSRSMVLEAPGEQPLQITDLLG